MKISARPNVVKFNVNTIKKIGIDFTWKKLVQTFNSVGESRLKLRPKIAIEIKKVLILHHCLPFYGH